MTPKRKPAPLPRDVRRMWCASTPAHTRSTMAAGVVPRMRAARLPSLSSCKAEVERLRAALEDVASGAGPRGTDDMTGADRMPMLMTNDQS